MKICTKCKCKQSKSEFTKDKSRSHGLASRCKSCHKIYREENKERIVEYKVEYREKNRTRISEYRAKYRKDNRKQIYNYNVKYLMNNKEWAAEYAAEWRANNKEYISENNATWYQNNIERKAKYGVKWRSENREKVREYERQRRLRKCATSQGIPYTSTEIYKRDNWVCQLCDTPVTELDSTKKFGPTIDHIIPLSKNGIDCETNVQLAHRSCNSKKGTRSMEEIGV